KVPEGCNHTRGFLPPWPPAVIAASHPEAAFFCSSIAASDDATRPAHVELQHRHFRRCTPARSTIASSDDGGRPARLDLASPFRGLLVFSAISDGTQS
ncbi:hypothetical protein, partial [Comamonas thiooxydans]|uniref:hypothetical protein n=1 Tax=Comamonas thiooxydans TaxID=363952 RepID=UPI00325FAEFB